MNKAIFYIKRIIPNHNFVRSVSILVGGSAAGQIIVIAVSPLLTRLYSPEDFGLLAVYSSLLGVLGVMASLRYELAIPLPENNEKAASILVLSLVIIAITTFLLVVFIWLCGKYISEFLNIQNLTPYLWLIPVGFFLVGSYQVFQYWAIRTKEFSNIAATKLVQSVGMVVIQLIGSVFGPIALLLGRVVGQSAGTMSLIRSALKKNLKNFKAVKIEDVQQAAREYRSFPLKSTWTGLASSGGSNLPAILIASFLGAGPAGMFALAHRVLSQPMVIIGRAVSDVFYRQAAEAYREKTLDHIVSRVYICLAKLALPPTVMGFVLIPDLFTLVFGQDWREAGEVARWMLPWLFLQLVVSPSTRVYPILGLHGIAFRFQLGLLFSSILSVLVGAIYFNNLIVTVALISACNALIYLYRAIYTFNLVGLRKRRAVIDLMKPLPMSLLCSLPIIALIFLYGGAFEAGLISVLMVALSFSLLVCFVFFSIKKVL